MIDGNDKGRNELKSACPFCGGNVGVSVATVGYCFKCTTCYAETYIFDNDRTDAVKMYLHRARGGADGWHETH